MEALPVALPPLNHAVDLPALPENPPSVEDVTAACAYRHQVTVAYSVV